MHHTADEFLRAVQSIEPDAYAPATVNGTGVDTRGYREALIVADLGDFTAGGTVDVTVEESSDDAAADPYAAITGAVMTQKTQGVDDNNLFVGRINLEKTERYIRPVAVVGTAAVDLAVSVILLNPRELPATQQNASEFSV